MDLQAPMFAYGKRAKDKHCILYPDHTFAGWPVVNLPSWQDLWCDFDSMPKLKGTTGNKYHSRFPLGTS